MYETIDTMLSFEKPSRRYRIKFSLSRMTNIARVQIEIPGEEESAVVINGIRESPSPIIDRNLDLALYSIKITNSNYMDYYGVFTVD